MSPEELVAFINDPTPTVDPPAPEPSTAKPAALWQGKASDHN